MTLHRKTTFLSIVLFCFLSARSHIIQLGDSTKAHLSIHLSGGAFVDFRLNAMSHNPFSWNIPTSDMPENNRKGAPFQGHFLCLGRWGAPTDGEIKAGVPHNGEAGNKIWDVVSRTENTRLVIRTEAPLDGIMAERTIEFDETNAIVKTTDKIQSTLSIGRPFNIVQHATIGPPFLTTSTIIDSNASKGFMQHLSYPNPHCHEYIWPNAIIDTLGTTVDLTSTHTRESYVSTHLFDDETGWITALSPEEGIVIGYIWKTKEYSWLNLWHEMKNGKPWAKGLEFGTCGIGMPYQDLLATDTRFHGVNSFFYLDALQEIKKSFVCFLVRVPKDCTGIKEIRMTNNRMILTTKNDPDNPIIINNQNIPL